ncbi:hypothetical protein [Pseudomonas reidholzensis]|uniref:hypothetical protein n=1 Tax=Pseudomonas reidholzensis TaxID=1785162 RepID=UPI000E5B6F3A|nr:hypothetical protein [Pseudomonas reidholzensis]
MLLPLLVEAAKQVCDPHGKWAITWVIGDTWVVHDGFGQWRIDPDEQATDAHITELLVRAGGVYELQGY